MAAAAAPGDGPRPDDDPDTREALRDAEGWNLTRFDPGNVDAQRGHLESTFIKLNDPTSPRALWVKLTIYAPTRRTSGGPPFQRGKTVAEAWAIAFDRTAEEPASGPPSYREPSASGPERTRHVAVKRSVPVEEAQLSLARPYALKVDGVSFDGRRLSGEIKSGGATVRFDLVLTPRDLAPLAPLPEAMYRGKFAKTKMVSPIFDGVADGEVVIEGVSGPSRRWEVRQWPAMQGHNWGFGHGDHYAWGHCNCWHEPEGRELALEGFTFKLKLGGLVTTPFLTFIAVRHRGVRYETRTAGELLRTRGRVGDLRRWQFRSMAAGARIEGSFSLRADDTVGLYYPNPDGRMTYCLNSKIAHGTLRFEPPGRAPLVLTTDAAALEIGTYDAAHGIRMYV